MSSSSASERAVIYVESSSSSGGAASAKDSSVAVATTPSSSGGSNYVIKIQIGEESMFNPVRIDVSAGGKVTATTTGCGGSLGSASSSSLHGPDCPKEEEPPESPILSSSEIESSCSGQSSPRSDMTPPPRINTGGANRFGSETSESDTESDISAEFRPISCQAAQFAMREICQVDSPPLRSIMKKGGGGSSNKPPPLPSSAHPLTTLLAEANANGGFITLGGVLAAAKQPGNAINKSNLKIRNEEAGEKNNNKIIGHILSLSEALAEKKSIENKDRGKILVDQREFHINEINGIGIKTVVEPEESLSNFAGYKDIFARTTRDGTKQILSDRGTIRGVKNRVRDGIATFLQSKDTKTYSEKEHGRVVVYVTSMGVVRATFLRCQKVKSILRNLLVKFDERDCYMNRAIQNEFRHRMSQQQLTLPQVFLEGQLLGDAEVIEKLNETGELRDLLKPYKSLSVLSTCERCGGFRMLPCSICNGSKKSVHRNHFTTEFIALKCMHCDPSGLVRCDMCNAPDA